MSADQWRVKVGAVAIGLGGVAVLGFGAAHGVLPEGSGQAVLRYVADHPHYAGVHLGSILGVVLWTAGAAMVPSAVTCPRASSFARLGSTVTIIGACVFVVQFAVDGFGHHVLATSWANASPDEQGSVARVVELLEVLQLGPAFAWTALLWGLPLILFGLALAFDERYPDWLAWPGMLWGAGVFAVAIIRFLQFTLLPDGLVFAAATLGAALWGLALGIVLWRRSGALHEPANPG